MKVAVFRKAHFNAAHRLYNPSWTDEKNDAVFGLCNNPQWHGHNYELVVKLVGEIDMDTGFVYDLGKLKEIIKEEVIERFDHKNLNKDTPFFRDKIPTAENIAVVIYNLLRDRIGKQFDIQVKLYETPRNFVEYPASI